MHYYKRNLGDYAKKAGRLTMLQHGAYTLIIDSCYDREQFPTLEEAIEWTWASNNDEIEAVKFVLNKFFVLQNGIYIQNRIAEELEDYHAKALINKRIAVERETKRKVNSTLRVQIVEEPSPNHKPITNNQDIKPFVLSDAKDSNQCPHQDIIEIYHEILPQCPKIRDWTPARQTHLRARWNEDKSRQSMEYWRRFFKFVADCDFLVGKSGEKPFFADLEWMVKSANFTKIRESKYVNR